MTDPNHAIHKVCEGQNLSSEASKAVFSAMVRGEMSEVQIAALLAGLKTKGESHPEITGAAEALREAAVPFPRPDGVFADCVGTGGDGVGTVNISTASSFVAAELGLPIIKHGNRSVSSKCGAADCFESSGVKLQLSPEAARKAFDEVGICFLYAPDYHSGLRHAGGVRKALKMRTIMNVLGPLVNPARPPRMMLGVYDPAWNKPLAHTLHALGFEQAVVVHGGGTDEAALHTTSQVTLLKHGEVRSIEISPEEAGLKRAPLEALVGGGPAENAVWLKSLLQGGATEPQQDSVALNTGLLLWGTGLRDSLKEAVQEAKACLREGRAYGRLQRLAEVSHG